jgi:exodeoxyribonuclease VII small subunit
MPRPAAKTPSPEPRTYREAYAALSRIAAELESGEADLDRVLPLIQEAQAAYEVCRERIEALRQALGEGGEDELDEDVEEEDE